MIKTVSNLILNPHIRNEDVFNLCTIIIRSQDIDTKVREQIRKIQAECIPSFYKKYEHYNPENISQITEILKNSNGIVTVTMTSCKRLDLFKKTVNSFLQCVLDKHHIKEWIVVDDNSSEEDRQEMKSLYPFIKFIYKTKEQKGHANSMNILRGLVNTKYVFHLEDDWTFFYNDQYLSKCLLILESASEAGQCLINRAYGERECCWDIETGKEIFVNGLLYYIHSYNELSNYKNCNYWPHYSLRPGMMKTEVWKEIGEYNKNSDHFEMEYAFRYVKKYKTLFLDSIYSYHTGRCTFERDNKDIKNAYDLNDEDQFMKKEVKLDLTEEEKKIEEDFPGKEKVEYVMKTLVLNMKKRMDRKKEFIVKNHKKLHETLYNFYDAVDGYKIDPLPKHLKLFENADYHYRYGIMGCALSHINMWKEFLVSNDYNVMLVLEDDVELPDNFIDLLQDTMDQLKGEDWDVCFLGHFLYKHLVKPEDRNTDSVKVEHKTTEWAMQNSMGGTIGYLINKRGALEMIKHINDNGVYNGIDWVMFKNTNIRLYYCYPHIVYSECTQNNDVKVDSDIQYDYNRLCLDINQRLEYEKKYWEKHTNVIVLDKKPIKELLLSVVCIYNIKDLNNTEIEELIKEYSSMPVGWYTFSYYPGKTNFFGEKIKPDYILSFPLSLENEDINKDTILYDKYLN